MVLIRESDVVNYTFVHVGEQTVLKNRCLTDRRVGCCVASYSQVLLVTAGCIIFVYVQLYSMVELHCRLSTVVVQTNCHCSSPMYVI